MAACFSAYLKTHEKVPVLFGLHNVHAVHSAHLGYTVVFTNHASKYKLKGMPILKSLFRIK